MNTAKTMARAYELVPSSGLNPRVRALMPMSPKISLMDAGPACSQIRVAIGV